MKFSNTSKSIAFAGCMMAFAVVQSTTVQAGSATDVVVAKMAEGNVTEICQGGRATITAAATKAVTALAQAGKISGDFRAIGKDAGSAFYKSKCS